MLSRLADSLFWLNRYMERAENLLRLASIHYSFSLDQDVHGKLTWKPVLEQFAMIAPDKVAGLEHDAEGSLIMLLTHSDNHNSVRSMVNKARENARGAQDHITKEVWEEVNQMYHAVNNPELIEKLKNFQSVEIMEQLTRHTVLFAGIADITMPRGIGWHFMNLGRYMERCLQTIVLLMKQLEVMSYDQLELNDRLQWRYLLLSLSGYELHLKSYQSADHNYNVLHQIMVNENFPRSVVYSLTRINIYLNRVLDGTSEDSKEASQMRRSFGKLLSRVKFLEPAVLETESIHVILSEIRDELLAFNRQLEQYFFSYS